MRAAVIEAFGGEPIVEEFADPVGEDVAQVVAAPRFDRIRHVTRGSLRPFPPTWSRRSPLDPNAIGQPDP